MKKQALLLVFLCLIFGVILAEFTSIPFWFYLLSELILMISFLILSKVRINPFYRTVYLLLIVVLFGASCFKFDDFLNDFNGLKANYKTSDVLIFKPIQTKKSASKFMKVEAEIIGLIKGKKIVEISDKALLFLASDSIYFPKVDSVYITNVKVDLIRSTKNPGDFDAKNFWKHKGVKYIGFGDFESYKAIQKARFNFSDLFHKWQQFFSKILADYLNGDELNIAKALILGDRSTLDAEIVSKFSNTGAMHILAVSGLHVGIVIQILTLFLSFFNRFINKKKALMISLIIVWIYALITGFSPSITRSVMMFTILSMSFFLERNYTNLNALAFSGILAIIFNPHVVFDLGFQLSYLAMFGIFLFYPLLNNLSKLKNRWLKIIIDGTLVGIAAQIVTIPFTLYYFHQFPNYFMITNVALMLFSFLILAGGIVLFSTFWIPYLNKLIGFLLMICVSITIQIVVFIDKLPWSVATGYDLNSFSFVILCSIVIFAYFAFKNKHLKSIYLTSAAVFMIVCFSSYQRYQVLCKNQITFFQTNYTCFAIKNQNKLFVFYSNPKKLDKVKFIVSNYVKIYPSAISYHLLDKNIAIKSSVNKFTISKRDFGYSIKINTEQFNLIQKQKNSPNIGKNIYASWIKNEEFNSLEKKSFTFLF